MIHALRHRPWLMLFPVAALISAAVGAYAGYDAVRVARHWRQTTGRIVELEPGDNGTFHPIIEFTIDGRRHRFRSNSGGNPAPFAIGESVAMLYDPTDPDHAVLDSFSSRYAGVIIGGILTVIFALAGWLGTRMMSNSLIRSPQTITVPPSGDRQLVATAWTFAGAGLICGTISFFILLHQQEVGSRWLRAEGEVLESWAMGGTTSQSLVRYIAADGTPYSAVLTIDSWSRYERGEKVEVAYDPHRPGRAILTEEIGPGFAFWLLAAFGLLFTGIGVAVYWAFRSSLTAPRTRSV